MNTEPRILNTEKTGALKTRCHPEGASATDSSGANRSEAEMAEGKKPAADMRSERIFSLVTICPQGERGEATTPWNFTATFPSQWTFCVGI